MSIPIIYVSGPSGCGKSSIAQALSEFEHFAFIEGDELHPASNISKMSQGTPLTDEDRWSWLADVRKKAITLASQPHAKGVIVTCSALKLKYREVLRKPSGQDGHPVNIHFLFLDVPKEELERRMQQRQGHYMKSGMLDSQLHDLELPSASEKDCQILHVTQGKDDTQQHAKELVNGMI